MEKVELLAPSGDLARLKIAVMYGADAVYIGGKKFSLRARASNFELADIKEGVEFAKQYGAKVMVTVNMVPHEEDLEGLEEYLIALDEIGVFAVICASFTIAKRALKVRKNMEVHLSTQNSSTNSSVVKFWQQQGVDRVVLGRELTIEETEETLSNVDLPIEVFIHGGMCSAYSGRCTLSNSMTARDANRGGCAQSCRWKYGLYENDVLISDVDDPFSMSSKDLMTLDYIPRLLDAKVASLKIEGRMKSMYYVAVVVRTYRQIIDEYYAKKVITPERMQYYYNEIARAENRLTSAGFYGGLPRAKGHLYGANGAGVIQDYVAHVLEDTKDGITKIQVRNNFSKEDVLELFSPKTLNTQFIFDTMFDEEQQAVEIANKPMQVLYVSSDVQMHKDDMIRKLVSKNREDVY